MTNLLTQEDIDRNYIVASNQLSNYINIVVPLLRAELASGFKVTQAGQMFKKDRARVRAILDSIPELRTRHAYIDVAGYGVYLRSKISYTVRTDANDISSRCYLERYNLVHPGLESRSMSMLEFQPAPPKTIAAYQVAKREIKRLGTVETNCRTARNVLKIKWDK